MPRHHHHHLAPDLSRYRHAIAGVIAITSVYVYFLIFAEFAFIAILRSVVKEAGFTTVMAALGLSGICGSLVAAKWFSPDKGPLQLAFGYVGCALAAGLSLLASNSMLAITAAIAVGGSLAWTTVALVLCLRPTVHLKRLGICCGTGTGLAYAICNQPLIFTASPRSQAIIAIFSVLIGLIFAFRLQGSPSKSSTSLDYQPLPTIIWLILFFGLVWIDSAAFFIIQHSSYLKADTWEGALSLQGNAFVHLCAAILAGIALDRHQQAFSLCFALLALLGACLLLSKANDGFPAARVFYTAGVSVYSTALVFYPARGGRPWLAGLLFAFAGWFGSSVGIGMAQSLHAIPLVFVILVAAVATVAFFVRLNWLKRVRLVERS
jgi:cytochrome c oxidase cbb3-type subunit 2